MNNYGQNYNQSNTGNLPVINTYAVCSSIDGRSQGIEFQLNSTSEAIINSAWANNLEVYYEPKTGKFFTCPKVTSSGQNYNVEGHLPSKNNVGNLPCSYNAGDLP